jgi:hypothetical protein
MSLLTRCIIPLRIGENGYSERIFKNLKKELKENWPFVVHIKSVVLFDSLDGKVEIRIWKKCGDRTLQEIYDDYKLRNGEIPIFVSFFNC